MRSAWAVGDVVVPPGAWKGRRSADSELWQHKYLVEPLVGVARLLMLTPVRRQEYEVLRACLIATHRLRPNFNFSEYVQHNLEAEYSKVVGISWELWVVIIVVVLVSGVVGWITPWMIIAMWILLLVINIRMVMIIRETTRGGTANQLHKGVFWFTRSSWVFLVLIRALLFTCSFIFASGLFFAWQFGGDSCFFKNSGMRAYAHQRYVVDVVLACLMLLSLGHVTLPLYSLVNHVSAEVRHGLLPTRVTLRLEELAHKARKQVRQQKEQKRRQAAKAAVVLRPHKPAHTAHSIASSSSGLGGHPDALPGAPTCPHP